MSQVVKMPTLNSNEDSAEVIKWFFEERSQVRKGQTIAAVETSKMAIDVDASEDGFFVPVVKVGDRVKTGDALGVLLDNCNEDVNSVLQNLQVKPEVTSTKAWTKKAELVATRLGVDIAALAEQLKGKQVTEADVVAANKPQQDVQDLVEDRYPATRRERVLLIGGGGGGGSITIDAIQRGLNQRAVGILDNNAALYGKTMMGVPILGPNSMVDELWKAGAFDAAIIVVTANVNERAELFESIRARGIRFTNVIDPAAQLRTNVSMGVGNLIMGNCFLAACVTLGDNNFLASHVCVEHHSVVGNHCTFGPRTVTSGGVTIGDRVKLGMNVMLEPYLTIGAGTLIPSGIMVVENIPENSVLKTQASYVIRSR